MAKIVGLKDVLLPKNQFVNEEIFGMESLKNGIITIRVNNAETIYQIAQKVNRCFTIASIFTNLRAVCFRYNGIQMYVDSSYSTQKEIVEQYYRKFRKAKDHDGNHFHRKYLYNVYRERHIKEMITEAIKSEKILFKNLELEIAWDKLSKETNNDLTSSKVIYFAECWAKYMQLLMKKHPNANISRLSESAMLDCEVLGVPFLAEQKAIPLLIEYWKYGDNLYDSL